MVDLSGQGIAPTGIKENPSAIPDEFALRGPYPNPFNPVTTFKVELPVASWVTLEVYDTSGRSLGFVLDGWRSTGTLAAERRWWSAEADRTGNPV